MKPLTRREQASQQIDRAYSEANLTGMRYTDLQQLKYKLEEAINARLGPLTGPTREQRRRLRQMKNNQIQGPGNSDPVAYDVTVTTTKEDSDGHVQPGEHGRHSQEDR